jgi:putative intracellular protease/amidase
MREVVIMILGDQQPGVEGDATTTLETVISAYYAFRDASAEVVLASPTGGYPRISLARDGKDEFAQVMRRFREDRAARDHLADTLSLAQVCMADFDAAFCIGRPGPLWYPDAEDAARLVCKFLMAGKPVAIIANHIESAPHGAGEGLLITGRSAGSQVMAAHALLAAMRR